MIQAVGTVKYFALQSVCLRRRFWLVDAQGSHCSPARTALLPGAYLTSRLPVAVACWKAVVVAHLACFAR